MARYYQIRVMTKRETVVEDVSLTPIERERLPEAYVEHIGQTEFRYFFQKDKEVAIGLVIGWMKLMN